MVLETTHVKTIYLSGQKYMKQIRRTFKEGIIPALGQGFGVQPRDFPLSYRKWHYVVKGFITSKLPHARAASAVVIQNFREDSDRDDCQVVSNSKFLEEDQDDWIPLSHKVAKAYAVTVSQAVKD